MVPRALRGPRPDGGERDRQVPLSALRDHVRRVTDETTNQQPQTRLYRSGRKNKADTGSNLKILLYSLKVFMHVVLHQTGNILFQILIKDIKTRSHLHKF